MSALPGPVPVARAGGAGATETDEQRQKRRHRRKHRTKRRVKAPRFQWWHLLAAVGTALLAVGLTVVVTSMRNP